MYFISLISQKEEMKNRLFPESYIWPVLACGSAWVCSTVDSKNDLQDYLFWDGQTYDWEFLFRNRTPRLCVENGLCQVLHSIKYK